MVRNRDWKMVVLLATALAVGAGAVAACVVPWFYCKPPDATDEDRDASANRTSASIPPHSRSVTEENSNPATNIRINGFSYVRVMVPPTPPTSVNSSMTTSHATQDSTMLNAFCQPNPGLNGLGEAVRVTNIKRDDKTFKDSLSSRLASSDNISKFSSEVRTSKSIVNRVFGSRVGDSAISDSVTDDSNALRVKIAIKNEGNSCVTTSRSETSPTDESSTEPTEIDRSTTLGRTKSVSIQTDDFQSVSIQTDDSQSLVARPTDPESSTVTSFCSTETVTSSSRALITSGISNTSGTDESSTETTNRTSTSTSEESQDSSGPSRVLTSFESSLAPVTLETIPEVTTTPQHSPEVAFRARGFKFNKEDPERFEKTPHNWIVEEVSVTSIPTQDLKCRVLRQGSPGGTPFPFGGSACKGGREDVMKGMIKGAGAALRKDLWRDSKKKVSKDVGASSRKNTRHDSVGRTPKSPGTLKIKTPPRDSPNGTPPSAGAFKIKTPPRDSPNRKPPRAASYNLKALPKDSPKRMHPSSRSCDLKTSNRQDTPNRTPTSSGSSSFKAFPRDPADKVSSSTGSSNFKSLPKVCANRTPPSSGSTNFKDLPQNPPNRTPPSSGSFNFRPLPQNLPNKAPPSIGSTNPKALPQDSPKRTPPPPTFSSFSPPSRHQPPNRSPPIRSPDSTQSPSTNHHPEPSKKPSRSSRYVQALPSRLRKFWRRFNPVMTPHPSRTRNQNSVRSLSGEEKPPTGHSTMISEGERLIDAIRTRRSPDTFRNCSPRVYEDPGLSSNTSYVPKFLTEDEEQPLDLSIHSSPRSEDKLTCPSFLARRKRSSSGSAESSGGIFQDVAGYLKSRRSSKASSEEGTGSSDSVICQENCKEVSVKDENQNVRSELSRIEDRVKVEMASSTIDCDDRSGHQNGCLPKSNSFPRKIRKIFSKEERRVSCSVDRTERVSPAECQRNSAGSRLNAKAVSTSDSPTDLSSYFELGLATPFDDGYLGVPCTEL